MKIYPAIDLRHGNVVQLVGGDPDKVAVESERTPLEQAQHWRQQGARRLHVVDLDAALGDGNQWMDLGRIIGDGLPVQFGGGIRSMLDVQKLLDLGVQRIIVGTQGVENPEWLRELAGLWPQRIVLAVDAHGRDVVVKGWTEKTGKDVIELVQELADAPLAGFLYTNVAKEGRLEGIDVDIVKDLRNATKAELIISGGVTTVQDLGIIDGLGIDGVVLGMSIYTDAIALRDAVERFEKQEPAVGA